MSNLAFNGVHYYLYDHLGNTRINYQPIVKCVAGSPPIISFHLNSVHDYYPYGKELRKFIDIEERYLSTQHERDSETGLDYRGARYYDSDLGRFLSLDPLATEFTSWSPYNYVIGNPVMLIDPDGKAPWIPRVTASGEVQLIKEQGDNRETLEAYFAGSTKFSMKQLREE
jgi:RHS repeat-associated protein